MDQAVIAGVGNLLADEALWQARLDPRRPAGSLSDEELDRLRREIRSAARSALRQGGAHTGRLMPERHPGGHCPRDGTELRHAQVGGRTTYWCPAEQH
jgi:formamidopyrimidine-DNA glycosylase